MISFQDRTFCPFWRDCADAPCCSRPLTDEVSAAARKWWGGDDAPIVQFMDKPGCHKPIIRGGDPI